MEKVYNKLVRDNIPEIIKNQGNAPVCRTLTDSEYITYLNQKLGEEVKEFSENNCAEELCDIIEVIKAIASALNLTDDKLKTLRESKKLKNGGFGQKILLEKIIYK